MPDPFHGEVKIPRDKGVPHGVYRTDGPPPSKRCNLQSYIEKGYDKKFFEEHQELVHNHDPKKALDSSIAEVEAQQRQQAAEEAEAQHQDVVPEDVPEAPEDQGGQDDDRKQEGEEPAPEEPEEAPVYAPPDNEDPTYGGHSDEELDRIRRAFDRFDADHSGAIDQNEIRNCLESIDVYLSDDQAESLINAVDTNHSGQIEFGEFVKLYDLALKKANEPAEDLDNVDVGEPDHFSGFSPPGPSGGDNISDEYRDHTDDKDLGDERKERALEVEEMVDPFDNEKHFDDESFRAEVNLEEIPDYEGLSYQDQGTIFTDSQ